MSFLHTPIHVCIMGASSGIGLALARRLAAQPNVASLTLCARRISGSTEVAALRASHSAASIRLYDADLTDEASLAAMAADLQKHIPALHLTINTAGVLHDAHLAPEKTLAQLDLPTMLRAFAVNACGPALLAKALLPLLRHAEPAG